MDRPGPNGISPGPPLSTAPFLYLPLGLVVLAALYVLSRYSFLLFHSLVEIFSIIIACGIFMVAWNARRFGERGFFLFLGLAYLYVAGLDLLHALAYKGMGVFPDQGSNLATQLWLGARYLEALTFLAAPLFFTRRTPIPAVVTAYSLLCAAFLLSVFQWPVFPVCFVEGQGLTGFKVASEYLISGLLLVSTALLIKRRKELAQGVARLLVWSILLTILSEMTLTLYTDVYGLANLVGHYLKLASYFLIYKAIIVFSLVKPYDLLFRDLKLSESRFQIFMDHSPLAAFIKDSQGRYVYANRRFCRMAGLDESPPLERTAAHIWPAEVSGPMVEDDARIISQGGSVGTLMEIPDGDGSREWLIYKFLLTDPVGERMVGGVALDLTERKRIEIALRASEEKFSKAFHASPMWVTISSPGRDRFLEVNDAFLRDLGYRREEIVGRPFGELAIWGRGESSSELAQFRTDLPVKEKEGFFFTRNGRPRQVLYSSERIMVGQEKCLLTVGLDITDRKQAEEQIRQALQEKEVLLKEIHHRVKNNMQVVYSLLGLQAARVQDRQVLAALQESQNRVRSMALIHESLYSSDSLAQFDFQAYVCRLADSLFRVYAPARKDIRFSVELDQVRLGLDQAVSCGLVLNELISNALKHAFPPGVGGELKISGATLNGGMTTLTIKDNGLGMPPQIDPRSTSSFGLSIVSGIVEKQLGGRMALSRDQGTEFTITLDHPDRQKER